MGELAIRQGIHMHKVIINPRHTCIVWVALVGWCVYVCVAKRSLKYELL